jgi:hypothetical protein
MKTGQPAIQFLIPANQTRYIQVRQTIIKVVYPYIAIFDEYFDVYVTYLIFLIKFLVDSRTVISSKS